MAFITTALLSLFFFAKTATAASVTSISPEVLTPGSTTLTITGSGFGAYDSAGDQVCFNYLENDLSYVGLCTTRSSTEISSWSDSTIVMTVTSDPGAVMIGGPIHVFTDYTQNEGPYYHMQPVITSLDKAKAFVGEVVKISGHYLKNPLGAAPSTTYYLRVYFNGVQETAALPVWTSEEIDATVPIGAATGLVTVTYEFTDGVVRAEATGPSLEIYAGATNDPYSSLQQYLQQVKIDQAWELAGSGAGPIVAVIDDGVYVNHPDLRDHIWINKKEAIGNKKDDDKNGYTDDIYGWNFINNNGEMTTLGTHGTMVAGIIGAVSNNQVGIAGINNNIKLMPLIVCNKDGCPTDGINKAIRYAADNGARIINLSLSTRATTGYSTDYNSAIQYAYNKGVIIVAAAGNGDVEGGIGQDLNIIPQSPVCNKNGKNMVIGVGAVDSENYLTAWSNYGNKCVDAYAPGVDIVTTAVPAYSTVEGFYDIGDGTSFAAPIISGIISLLVQKYPTISQPEVLKRLWRDQDGGVINAQKVLADTYTASVKERETYYNKNTKVDTKLTNSLKGKLLLQTQGGGRIWYVNPKDGKRYEVTTANALPIFRKLALGITNSDLAKIPMPGQKISNQKFVENMKGKLLLQIQDKGRVWYVNPKDGIRYEISVKTVFKIFKSLSLGITDANLNKIYIGFAE